MAPKALLTGAAGQNGYYLTHLLLEKGYEVHGLAAREGATPHPDVISHISDVTDSLSFITLLQKIQPDEIYNLAAKGDPAVSFLAPEYTASVNAIGALVILEAIMRLQMERSVKFYQASTALLFGNTEISPQTETTPFYPRSPYAVAKLFAHAITINYREAYGLYACNGILFTHESPRRPASFVTRKITQAVAKIHLGQQEKLFLGNLNAMRDWGHAQDYCEAQWLMLQQTTAHDYVIATGEQHSVREFVELAFKEVGIQIQWKGHGVLEIGIACCPGHSLDGKTIVEVDPQYFRPLEPGSLLGDASKARQELGWTPRITFQQLVSEMVQADLNLL